MDFQFVFGKTFMFWPITHTHSTPSSTCCTFLLGQLCRAKGVMLQQDKYIFGNYGITNAKGHLWVWNKKLVMMHPQIP
jgi:hypothetical protein